MLLQIHICLGRSHQCAVCCPKGQPQSSTPDFSTLARPIWCVRAFVLCRFLIPTPPPPLPPSLPPTRLALSARLLLLFAAELRVRRQRSDAPDDDGLFDALLDAQLHRATRIHVHFFTSRSRTRRSPMPETPAPFALNWYCVSVPFGICFRVLLPLQRRSVNGPAGAERHERCRSTGMTSTILVDWDSYDHV